jgi:hypothetical protein
MNTEITLKVPEELYNHALQIAQKDQRNVAEVLAEFARVGSNFFNDKNSDLSDSANVLEAEEEAFLKMHTWLKGKYLGKYVAIYNQELADHNESLDALSDRIYKRFGNTPVWISKVKENPVEEWIFRSPQFVKVNDNDL